MLLNDRDQIIAMTAEWTGERYPNGRPRVSDEKIEILKNLTQEEIWQPLYSCGYRFQFQGDLKPLHPDKKLYGRAVTCCFMPQRPDLRQHVFNVARSRGWKGDCNQWVIDSLEESDVVVCDLYDKILRGTFVGGNLTTTGPGEKDVGWGVIQPSKRMTEDKNSGLIQRYNARGLPVLHLLNVKRLVADYGLPYDPDRYETPGQSALYRVTVYPRWAALAGLAGAAALLWWGFRHKKPEAA